MLAGQCARVAQYGGAVDAAGDERSRLISRPWRWLCRKAATLALPLLRSPRDALADRVDAFEREVILAELKRSHSNVSLAAKSLGLERSHLYKKAEHLGIDLRAMRREQAPVRFTCGVISTGRVAPLRQCTGYCIVLGTRLITMRRLILVCRCSRFRSAASRR